MSKIEIVEQGVVDVEEMDLVAEAEPEIAEQVPSDDPADGSESAPPEDVPEVPEADCIVRCNSCHHERRKSSEEPCPNGHEAGWSYVGPVPAEESEPDAEDSAREEVEVVESGSVVNDAHEKRSTGFEWALQQIIEVNQEAIEQKARVKEAQATLKDEKETLESIQDNLNRLIQEAAKLKSQAEPDPDKFPLFDRPKEPTAKDDINQMFAKPQAIQPLPADTEDEFYRRKRRDTRFDSLGLKPKVVEILAEAGYHTVLDLDRLHEAQADITTIRSAAGNITEKRGEEIRDALGELAMGWKREWDALHPAPEAEVVADSPEPAAPGPEPGDPPIDDPNIPVGPPLPAAAESEVADA